MGKLLSISSIHVMLLSISLLPVLRRSPWDINLCSGHGECYEDGCHCVESWLGADCGTSIYPVLSSGHFNLSRQNYSHVVSKSKVILVGFSAHGCFSCREMEFHYKNISDKLLEMKVPFARADGDALGSIALAVEAKTMPALVLYKNNRPTLFKGPHLADLVTLFVQKQLDKPVKLLKTVKEVTEFIESRESPQYTYSTVMVVGFFSDHGDTEEDEYLEFTEAAKDLQTSQDIYFGVVTNAATAQWFKQNKTIARTPSIIVKGEDNGIKVINLEELYGNNMNVKDWIKRSAIPLVGKLSGHNAGTYEKVITDYGIPIVMLFLDLSDELNTNDKTIVGGKTGEIFNEVLIQELRIVAKSFVDRAVFVYVDGIEFEDNMIALGLTGGRERLPSIAINNKDGLKAPFSEILPFNHHAIASFTNDFLNGRIQSPEDSLKRAKIIVNSSSTTSASYFKYSAVRPMGDKKDSFVMRKGSRERFGDGMVGDEYVRQVTSADFSEVILNVHKDVVLLLHSSNACKDCAKLIVHLKRIAHLLIHSQNVTTIEVAHIDLSKDFPPESFPDHNLLLTGSLPLLVLFPAGQKEPPWNFYSGIGDTYQIIDWIHSKVAYPFQYPDLSLLDSEDYLLGDHTMQTAPITIEV